MPWLAIASPHIRTIFDSTRRTDVAAARAESELATATLTRWMRFTQIIMWGFQVAVIAHGRGPGERIMRIRIVDARTGAPPGVPRAAARVAVATLVPAGLSRLMRLLPAVQRDLRRMTERTARVDEARRAYGHDEQRLSAEMRAILDERAQPWFPWGLSLSLLGPQCVLWLPALRTPMRQGLHDVVARTVVIRDE